jgi:hypothetical protein
MGAQSDGAVVQINSHPYVDVDTLARIMNAAVSFEQGRVILTVPSAEAGVKPERSSPGLSRLCQSRYFPIGGDVGVEGRHCSRDQVWNCRGKLARSLATGSPAPGRGNFESNVVSGKN